MCGVTGSSLKYRNLILADIGIHPSSINPEKPIRDQVSLDSMQFISLIAKLEIELEVEMPIGIMQVMTLREFYKELGKAFKARTDHESTDVAGNRAVKESKR